MKSGSSSKLTAIAFLCLSLGMYAMAQMGGGVGGHAGQTIQSQQSQSSMHQSQCFTGREKREHGKRIVEIAFDNGVRLWLEIETEGPLWPICGQ